MKNLAILTSFSKNDFTDKLIVAYLSGRTLYRLAKKVSHYQESSLNGIITRH